MLRRLQFLLYRLRLSLWLMQHSSLRAAVGKKWARRIADVCLSADNAHILRVADAGSVRAGTQIMHNGIAIRQGCYYGNGIEHMLALNRGVHEPQEERVFGELIKLLPDGAMMMELGAYWAFYSMWFQRSVRQARSILVEATAENLAAGEANFALNQMSGTFIHACVADQAGMAADGTRSVSIDSLMAEYGLNHLNVLHSDIQGHELAMLDGAVETLGQQKVDYVFISTHLNSGLHRQCAAKLAAWGYHILHSIDLDETFSDDGLIVASRPGPAQLPPMQLSRRYRKFSPSREV
jgi:hypothetical protein